jgi:predicted Zn-dependent protease
VTTFEAVKKAFKEALPKTAAFASLRLHQDREERLSVRQDVFEPPALSLDAGAMVTVHHNGGAGYAATSDLSAAGLRTAFQAALTWAERAAAFAVADYSQIEMPHPRGEHQSPVRRRFEEMPLKEKAERLVQLSKTLHPKPEIVDWSAELWRWRSERLYLTSGGGEVYQDFDWLTPMLSATANRGTETITRSFGGHSLVRKQGLELLDDVRFFEAGRVVAEEALELLLAPNCPSGRMHVLLAPDQMTLQIHESIGHPLELDRILGDERNYAGTSFVTPAMFGSFQYGSKWLNVTYDPTRAEQAASFAYDDEGLPAKKEFLIKDGLLLRGLGGGISQARATLGGVANSRADSWRRPAIDRMANVNVEPGPHSLAEMIASVEKGIYVKTNNSWSIDDSRNKFQFGCEWGRLIENGKLTKVVKKPNYRGISANFWQSLVMVGGASEVEVLGTPYCGKGEPNQAIVVGHASPPCLFEGVDVFGGE